jgi:hypothetical protein
MTPKRTAAGPGGRAISDELTEYVLDRWESVLAERQELLGKPRNQVCVCSSKKRRCEGKRAVLE